MELIITEKNNAARRIAEILSDGGAQTQRDAGVPIYAWGGTRCIGLSGHVVGVDFPSEYNDWRDVEPRELVGAQVVKTATQEDIVNALKRLAQTADSIVIATDYDREGELIGKEAYELVREVNESAPVKRVRFSSITENEVKNAFANPDDLDFDLAAAGEARQIVDLIWGAALTRFLSLSARQMGEDFISVGRVQSPTLKLVVDKEREIEAFEPDDYWELFADLTKETAEETSASRSESGDSEDDSDFEAQYYYLDEDDNEAERVWDEDDAEAAFADLRAAATAIVESVNRRTRTDDPPAPFNTTQFIRAAGSLGYGAGRAMSIAEDLYTAGYITYPRTDNTVYPTDLDPAELVAAFIGTYDFGDDAKSLLETEALEPTRGENETTDHPPIHPTEDLPNKQDLSEDEWEIYELVVRRFFATVADAAVWEHLKVVADANGRKLKANGKRLLEPGYHTVYPYYNTSENFVPHVDEGEELPIADTRIEAKETQPPRRFGQSRLIERMEELGLGTKCLTGDSRVLVRDDTGDVARRSIANIFEDGEVVMADGDTDIAVTEDGPTTVSFDETTERITDRTQTLVSKRPLESDERVYRVTTDAGSFDGTGDHPVYAVVDEAVVVKPVVTLEPGDELLASRAATFDVDEPGETVNTWNEFAASCDKDTKLYGVDCGTDLETVRTATEATQLEFAGRLGTHRAQVTRYENGDMDVPVWILGAVDIRPEELHGLNYEATFDNPFPLEWTPELARLFGSVLGDGSIYRNAPENTIDIRYHNTDPRLVSRFVSDVESVFGTRPAVSKRAGREEHHLVKYQVQLPSAVARVLEFVLDEVTDDSPVVPSALRPAFVGALFDDEGHISTDGKAFISNTDHDLLTGVSAMLASLGIETRLDESQHKLYVRGRRNLERFLDTVPIAADRKFYRGLDRLQGYPVTERKAACLELLAEHPYTTAELAAELDVTRALATSTVRELIEDGHVEKRIEGSNRSHDSNRTFWYSADSFEQSIYATLRGRPKSTTVTGIHERDYDGPVYDLTIDESTPNFAVEGGIIVHNSTRHNTIEKLYDRGYIESDPPRPTKLAKAVVEAAEEFADLVVSEEMTSQLEADMTAIAEGNATLDDVTQESRELLDRIFDDLSESREEIGDHLQTSLKADKTLGPCPECGEDLLVRRSRRGSYFVGCDGYPDCRYTLPLPNTGEPLVLDETCEEHDLRHVKMLAGRNTFVHGCPQCAADMADEEEDEVIGPCPECSEEHGGELAIKRLRSGSRLVGCTRYPDCEYSLPLPRRGDIEVTDEYCEEHDLPELVVDGGSDEPWELGCPICNYKEYQERQQRRGLETLEGVGPKTAEKLEAAGISDVSDLTGAEADDLADQVEGVSADTVREWQTKAGNA